MMLKRVLGKSKIKVSRLGIGGHYKAIEVGQYDERSGYVDREVEERCALVDRAVAAGINYFDTTWRNETEMLAKVLKKLGLRNKVVVNGMVLGAFNGSKAMGMEVEEYFNRHLDTRLEMMPDNRFDTFMINAIEEGFDEYQCDRLVKLLEKRKAVGDFEEYGFSCHDPFFARKIADKYPEFQTIMIPYNFRNRKYEEAFQGYKGNASLIAMKPLVWMEYGIPFCAVNLSPGFESIYGFKPVEDISTKALKFILSNSSISSFVCSVNTMEELEWLIAAQKDQYTLGDCAELEKYNQIQDLDNMIPMCLAALKYDNFRMNYFGMSAICRKLGIEQPNIQVDQPDARHKLMEFMMSVTPILKDRGYEKYI